MSEIKVGDEVLYKGYDVYGTARATVESISVLNGRQFASIRIGQRELRVYVNDLKHPPKIIDDDPAPDLAEQLAQAQRDLAAANERVTMLEDALRPFAEAAEDGTVETTPSGYALHVLRTDRTDMTTLWHKWDMLDMGDLRAARDALKAGRK